MEVTDVVVRVTKEHMRTEFAHLSTDCMFARAMLDAGFKHVIVGVTDALLLKHPGDKDSLAVSLVLRTDQGEYLPNIIINWVAHSADKQSIEHEPFTVTLQDIPVKYLIPK